MNKTINKIFDKAFAAYKERGWEHIYVAIDVHNTLVWPTYDEDLELQFYPGALQALRLMKEEFGDTFKFIMWTSTTPEYIEKYKEYFAKYGLYFDYVNENPEVVADNQSAVTADFSRKFYFNIGLDDKFGFDPIEDWLNILDYFNERFDK